MFAYCNNNPINFIDDDGTNATTAQRLKGVTMLTLLCAIAAKVGGVNIWNPVGWVILGIAAVGVISYTGYKIYKNTRATRIKSDVKLKRPPTRSRVYQLAYANSKGEIIRLPGKMTYNEAVAALYGSAKVNSLMKEHKGYWGIYTNNQANAKALAVAFGGKGRPEVHGSGYYAHYHDAQHRFHVWYGGKIRY